MSDGSVWVLWALWAPWAAAFTVLAYLFRVNQQLSGTPEQVRRLPGPQWTPDLLRETYERLQQHPIDYTHKLPPKLKRRYIVTGGSGELFICHP
jgi:hypothetical protein